MRIDDKEVLNMYIDTSVVYKILCDRNIVYDVSRELEYEKYDDGVNSYYIVTGRGRHVYSDIIIPSTYKNLPVTKIAANAFLDEDITTVTIPKSITNIERSAFKNCYALSTVYFNAINCQDNDYNGADTFYNAGKNNTNGVTVIFGKDVTRIPKWLFRDSGYIKTIDLRNSTNIKEILSATFTPFNYTSSLSNVYFHNNIEKIGENAFNKTKISSITLPANLKEIGASAFASTNLSNITIPQNVTSIGNSAFGACSDVTYEGDASTFIDLLNYPISNLNRGPFATNATIRLRGILNDTTPVLFSNGTLIYPYISAEHGGIGNRAHPDDGDIKRVIVSHGIPSIGEEAFARCSNLKEIYIPKSVTNIGTNAFLKGYNSTGITTVHYEGNAGMLNELNGPEYKVNNDDYTTELVKYDTGLPINATKYTNEPMYKFVNY